MCRERDTSEYDSGCAGQLGRCGKTTLHTEPHSPPSGFRSTCPGSCTGAYTLFYTHRSHSPQSDVGRALSQSLKGAGSTEGRDA